MAILKCKMCGGELDIIEDSNVVECEYCGSKQTIPDVDDEKKLRLYDRANKLRMACDYDKAAGVYESIVAEFPDEAEAYWGLILCKYGIEYVDDPATGKKIPTCHRSSFDSVMDDPNFDMVMENAEFLAVDVYRAEAKQIEEIRKRIVEISNAAEDYDIFICYKETAEDGDRTIDSVIAQDVYDALTSKGYKVFFARVSLEDKLGKEYEPYIFSALNTSEIMLVFGTDYKYFNAVWVKNEWSRFLKLMEKDPKKSLIPCYKNIDAYDMPKEFAKLQAQDMGKVGAIQDLIRGIEKLIGSKTVAKTKVEIIREKADSQAEPLIKRGNLALENEKWESAKEYFDQSLNFDPENPNAYIGIVLADAECSSLEEYVDIVRFKEIESRTKQLEQSEKVSQAINNFTICNMLSALDIESKFKYDLFYTSTVDACQELLEDYENDFSDDYNWKNAINFASGELKDRLCKVKTDVLKLCKEKLEFAQKDEEEKILELKSRYEAFVDGKYKEIEEHYNRLDKIRLSDYNLACNFMADAKDSSDYQKATDKFNKLGDYKDSKKRATECKKNCNRLMEEERRERERLAKKEAAKRNRKIVIVSSVVIVLALLYGFVLYPKMELNAQYKEAIRYYDAQDYEDAIREFKLLGNYKESKEYIKKSKYEMAKLLMQNEKYEDAVEIFTALGDFEDSIALLEECNNGILAKEEERLELEKLEAIANFSYYNETYNYFIEHKQEYTKLSGSEIEDIIVGTWNRRYAFADTCIYAIYDDGTCKQLDSNYEIIYNWEITGDVFKAGFGSNLDKYDIYDIGDGYYMMYDSGTSEPKILMWK